MMSARMAKTCASLMKLGPSDAIRAVSLRARSRCTCSFRKRGGPATIHRRRSRRNATRNGARRYQTTKIRRNMAAALEFQLFDCFLEQREIGVRCRHAPVFGLLENCESFRENRPAAWIRQAEN